MFKTIFTVTKKTCDSTEYSAFFEDFDKAKEFAEKESKGFDKDYLVKNYKKSFDGSFSYMWADFYREIWLDNYAWIDDYNGIRFSDKGIIHRFPDFEEFRKFILRSQEIALS